MIMVKTKLNLTKYDFVINYFENESITDFEYLIILMTNEAIDKKIELSTLIKDFTKGENDVKLLIEKRFKSLFKTTVDKFKDISVQAKKMESETKRLVPAKENVEILYEPNLKLFLHNKEFKNERQLKKELSYKIESNKNLTFNNVVAHEGEEVTVETFDIELSPKFDKFNILNLEKQKNQEILDVTIKTLKEETEKYIEFDSNDIISLPKYDESYGQILRSYGSKTRYANLVGFDEFWNESILEFDYSGIGFFVMSIFKKWNEVVLVNEIKYNIDDFKSNKSYYDDFLEYFENNSDKIPVKFQELFLEKVSTKKEMKLAEEINLFTINKKIAISKISEMIKFNINLITDEYVAKNELVDYHISNNQIELYKYLDNFYGKNKFVDIGEKRKKEILYSVFKSDSSILTKLDHKEISSMVKDSDYIKEKIIDTIAAISSLRSPIKESIDNIESHLKNDDLSSDEFISATELKSSLDNFRRITNFFVHIRDKEGKDYKKDIKAAKEYNEKFIDLRSDIKNFYNETLVESLSEKYIDILKELEMDMNGFLKEAKKFK